MANEIDSEQMSIGDYLRILRRRRYYFAVPALIAAVIGFYVAVSMPPNYRSVATILIEEQSIPDDLLPGTVSNFATQRIQVLRKRILTNSRVAEIVDKLDLYGYESLDEAPPISALGGRFNSDLSINLVSAEVIDPRSARPTEAAIAFTVAFRSEDPETAKRVATELADIFLEESTRSREDTASSVTDFIVGEAAKLQAELAVLEQQLAQFKADNEGALPEMYQYTVGALERAERELANLNTRAQELQKRRLQISAELSQMNPNAPIVLSGGEVVMGDREQLRSLLAEYRRKSARYSEKHPDLIRITNEIRSLRESLGAGGEDIELLSEQLDQARSQLTAMRESYPEEHERVVETNDLVAELERKLAVAQRSGNRRNAAAEPTNPAYILLNTQLQAIDVELRTSAESRAAIQERIARYEDAIRRGPEVERQYQSLLREYETTNAKYLDLKEKQREAEIAENVETAQKGGRLTLIEPAALPLAPTSPNRNAIFLLGIVLGCVAGLMIVVLAEAMDESVYGEEQLSAIVGERPLVVVPFITNTVDQQHQRQRRLLMIGGSALLLIACVVYLQVMGVG